MNNSKTGWDLTKLHALIDRDSIKAIRNIPFWRNDKENRWAWAKAKNGAYSVKSAYKGATNASVGNEGHLMSRIWESNLHEKLKMLLWRTADLLPSKEMLSRYVPNIKSNCPMCDSEAETTIVIHLFSHCQFARSIWFAIASQWGIKIDSFQLDVMQKEQFLLFGDLALDLIWKARNRVIHKNLKPSQEDLSRKLQKLFLEHWCLSSNSNRLEGLWCLPMWKRSTPISLSKQRKQFTRQLLFWQANWIYTMLEWGVIPKIALIRSKLPSNISPGDYLIL